MRDGKEIQQSITVKEFRDFLSAYPDDLPVIATWEGVFSIIIPEKITIEKAFDDWETALIVDVEKSF